MSRVRDLTARLKLATRRPSYLDWLNSVQNRSKEIGSVLELHPPRVLEEGVLEEEITDESRKKNLRSALNWLKTELQEMRQQDQQLARQLMQLRIELQRVRLLRSCNNHQALVDEVRNEAEEARTFESSDLCDVPQDLR
ncbi:protein FAM167B-like isoform X2 [Penaeus monodon]|nr:protein FAM167B-like isoform X2 [Penaeus monodon]